jgi:hypothetical protein
MDCARNLSVSKPAVQAGVSARTPGNPDIPEVAMQLHFAPEELNLLPEMLLQERIGSILRILYEPGSKSIPT